MIVQKDYNQLYTSSLKYNINMNMQEKYDIVMLSSARSDDPYSSSALSLAKELSKNNRVFFIDHPFSLRDYLSKYSQGGSIKRRRKALLFGKNICHTLEGTSSNLKIVTPRLTLPINWMKEGKLYNCLSAVNDRILVAALKNIIKEYGIKQYIFINVFVPYYFRTIPDNIKPALNIYYTVDDISQEAYIAKHGVRLEKEVAASADIALATSKELTSLLSNYSNNVHYLPNAADTSLFATAVHKRLNKPEELQSITQKVICYTGNIGSRINYNLLKRVALQHQDKVLLMVGPTSSNDYKEAGLDKLPNVIFTGPKSINELPNYLQYSHCAIIPFEYSTLTKSIYPLKINEYLAAGIPVVSTAFSEDMIGFADVAAVAHSEDEFIHKIAAVIEEDTVKKQAARMDKARANTWKARVAEFWNIVEQHQASETAVTITAHKLQEAYSYDAVAV